MPDVQNTLVFSSILFLIVFESSSRYRDEDLHSLAQGTDDYLFYILPNLGVFSIVHMLNTFLLMMGYLLVLTTFISGDELSISLLFFTYIILLIVIPYLEVQGYEEHLSKIETLSSFKTHLAFSSLIVGVFPSLLVLRTMVSSSLHLGLEVSALIAFTTGVMGGIFFFLKRLKQELRMFR